MKFAKNKKGFTLVELLVVMAILGVLLLIGVPRFAAMTENASKRTVEVNQRQYVSAVNMYYADHNEYPATEAVLYTEELMNDLSDKPKGAEYHVVDGVVTATLPVAAGTFTVEYDPATGETTTGTN